MKALTTGLALLAISFGLYAQQPATLSGKVQSALTGEGIPYVNLYIEGTMLGTTSNIQGEYVLNVPAQSISGTLIISSPGYTTARIPLATATEGEHRTITLRPAAVLLQAVEVRAEKQTIVEAAIAAISRNYDNEPLIMMVFTRALSKREDYPIQASEAAFEIYRGKIQSNSKKTVRQLHISKGRLSRDSAAFRKIHQINIGTTPVNLFRLDFVREASILHNKKELGKHMFTLLGVMQYNDRPAYKIGFDQKDSLKEALYKGVMYIDTASLAFMHIEIGWSDKGMPYLTETFENKAAAKLLGLHKSRWNFRNIVFDYTHANGKWYPHSVTIQGSFQLIREKEGLHATLLMDDLFLITEIVKDDVHPFPEDQIARRNQHIEKQYDAYDAEFWKGYNYQLPDPGFKEVFEAIQQRNKANRPAGTQARRKSQNNQ